MASDKITIICAVAAEFSLGGEKFTVGPKDRGIVMQAPAWIQNTLIFNLLSADGSLKFVTPANKIQMENEPMLGMNAEGKEMKAEPKKAEQKVEEKPVVTAEVVEAEPVEKVAEEATEEQPKPTRKRKTASAE